MTEEIFADYLEYLIQSYAADNVKSGRWTEVEALERSRREAAADLPDGLQTSGQHLFTVHNEVGEKVGVIWMAELPNQTGWINDVEIDAHFQRRGYGEATFYVIEAYAKSLGLKKIGLNVFGYNRGAIALYQKLGYETLDIVMGKTLE